jgi:preprotein translocase subunit SecA
MTVRIETREEIEAAEEELAQQPVGNVHYEHADFNPNAAPEELLAPAANSDQRVLQPVVNLMPKVGRNDPCPCGSGKKYKQCHGRLG